MPGGSAATRSPWSGGAAMLPDPAAQAWRCFFFSCAGTAAAAAGLVGAGRVGFLAAGCIRRAIGMRLVCSPATPYPRPTKSNSEFRIPNFSPPLREGAVAAATEGVCVVADICCLQLCAPPQRFVSVARKPLSPVESGAKPPGGSENALPPGPPPLPCCLVARLRPGAAQVAEDSLNFRFSSGRNPLQSRRIAPLRLSGSRRGYLDITGAPFVSAELSLAY